MENSWIDPLSPDQTELVSLSTGVVVPSSIAQDILKAQSIGEDAYQKFKTKRLEKISPTTKFYDSMKKQNLKTFSDMKRKQAGGKAQGKQVIWVKHGLYPRICFKSLKALSAECMHLQRSKMLMNYATISSVQSVERLNLVSFHHARTVCACIFCAQIIRLLSGDIVL